MPGRSEHDGSRSAKQDIPIGVGRKIITSGVAELSADRLAAFGFTVEPKEGPLYINYVTKNRLERWGKVTIQAAHASFAKSGEYNESLSIEVGTATLTQFSFRIPGIRSLRHTWSVLRGVMLDDDLYQQELLPFLGHVGPEDEIEANVSGLFVGIGKLAMPDTSLDVRRQKVDDFLREQPNYDIPNDHVDISPLATHWVPNNV